jgi:hypothetical protein
MSKGYDEHIYLPLCISFFPLSILDVIFLILCYPRTLLHDMETEFKKINDRGYVVFKNATQKQILNFCTEKFFTPIQGDYLHKRCFCFFIKII